MARPRKVTEEQKRIKKLETHLHELILVLENPKPAKKELNKFLNEWFDKTKLLINEH